MHKLKRQLTNKLRSWTPPPSPVPSSSASASASASVAAPTAIQNETAKAKHRRRVERQQRRVMGKPLKEEEEEQTTTTSNETQRGGVLPPLVRTLSKDIDRDEQNRLAHVVDAKENEIEAGDDDDDPHAHDERRHSTGSDTPPKPSPVKVRGVGHTTSEGYTGHANEDRYIVQQGEQFHLFAVMDGHGGDSAAEYLVEKLYATLETVYTASGASFDDKRALAAAIDALDLTFLAIADRKRDDSGACFNAVVLYYSTQDQCHQTLVLNCGDCRAILREAPEKVRRGSVHRNSRSCADDRLNTPVVALSEDHCASNRSEKLRALEAGAFIRNKRIAGILEPFRSVGDLDMKGKSMHGWVIPTPEIRERELAVNKTTLVIATDGVWSVLSNQRVMLLAMQEIADGGDEQTAAEAIAEEAREIGSSDDITVLVVSV